MTAAASTIRLMMTTDTVGGVWIYATTLACALGEVGFEVLLVTMGPRPTATQRLTVRECPGVALLETDLQLEWQDPAGTDLRRAGDVLGAAAERFGPDLVHLNGFREAMFAWSVPTVVVAHSCVNSWADACGETESFTGDAWKAYGRSVQAGLQNAHAWVAPTHAFRDQVKSRYRPARDGRVIWNGVAASRSSRRGKQSFVLSAGRLWDKAKNLSVLASAAAAVDWPVRIAGASRVDGTPARLAGTNCEFLGEVPHAQLLAEMESASVFVSPALYEPFGLAILEAARAGCALLLSDLSTLRELWDGAAVFFDPRDPAELTACLRSLCRDDRRRAVLQHAAMARSRTYAVSRTVDRYRTLYDSLLADAADTSCLPRHGEMTA